MSATSVHKDKTATTFLEKQYVDNERVSIGQSGPQYGTFIASTEEEQPPERGPGCLDCIRQCCDHCNTGIIVVSCIIGVVFLTAGTTLLTDHPTLAVTLIMAGVVLIATASFMSLRATVRMTQEERSTELAECAAQL